MSDSLGDALTNPIAQNITFLQIPSNIQTPGNYIEIDENYSNLGLLPFPARILLVGPMAASGTTATSGTIYHVLAPAQGPALFGASSPLTDMVAGVLASNPTIPVDAIGLTPTGSPATGSITFAGAATVAGSQAIGLAGNRIAFNINAGDSATTMATNFIAAANAINALTPLPFTLTNAAGVVTATAKVAGAQGNLYDLRVNPSRNDTTVPGVTVTIAAMSGGTGTPTLTSVFTAIAATWYTDIMFCWNDSTTQGAIASFATQQDNAMVAQDFVGYTCWSGTQGAMATLASTLNSRWIAGIGITNPQNPPWMIGAALLGIAAEQFMNDPSRQLRGLILPNIIAPAQADQIMQPERNALLLDGIGTYTATVEGTVAIDRLVTTYLQSNLGVPDQSWQDIMSTKVMSRIRWDWSNYVSLVYPNYKLGDDGSLAAEYDPNVMTCRRLRASWAARCQLYEKVGWIENSATTAQNSTFVRDPNNRNKVNCQLQVQVIGNLMITAAQLLFNAGS